MATKKKNKKRNTKVVSFQTPEPVIEMKAIEENNNNNTPKHEMLERIVNESIEVKEPIQTKKHSGHEYKETCNCAMCKKKTEKIKRESLIKQEAISELAEKLRNDENEFKNFIGEDRFNQIKNGLIDEYVKSLDDQDKIIIHFNEETKNTIAQNLSYVVKNYGEFSIESVNKLVNNALNLFLKKYIHHV